MAKETRCEWQLFIDESGDFSKLNDITVVGGLLVRASRHPVQGRNLRDAFVKAFPGLKYPPHASLMNRPVGRLVASDANSLPVLKNALEILVQDESSVTAPLRKALEKGRSPKYEDIQSCDIWFQRQHPRPYDELRGLMEKDHWQMRALLGQTPQLFDAKNAFIVGAGRLPPSARREEDGEEKPGDLDTYLASLTVVFERVFSLLRSTSGNERHQVWVTVATRNVPFGSTRRPIKMRVRDLGQSIERAAPFPYLPTGGLGDDRTRIVPQIIPQAYDAQVPPGLVLADFIVNRLRWAIRDARRDRSWEDLRRFVSRRLALPVEAEALGFSTLGPLPSLAASGRAQEAIRTAFAGNNAEASRILSDLRPRWAADQARRWTEAAATQEVGA